MSWPDIMEGIIWPVKTVSLLGAWGGGSFQVQFEFAGPVLITYKLDPFDPRNLLRDNKSKSPSRVIL